MIYVNKILPLFFLPLGITLTLAIAGLVLRRNALCWLGVGVLWVASTPWVGDAALRLAEGGQIRLPIGSVPEAQAIVVLSGGRVQPPGDPTVSEWTDADRFFGGVELFKAKKAPLLVFTGGWVPWQPHALPEGDVLIPYAAELGIPRDRMLTTGRVVKTEEEARAVAEILTARLGAAEAPRILLVTSALHMRRAAALFASAGIQVLPFPVDFKVPVQESFTLLTVIPSLSGLGRTETALREFYGLLFYAVFSR